MMLTWNEAQKMLRVVLRWWWVVVLAIGLASGTAYYLSRYETRYYVARSSLMIGNTLVSTLPDATQIGIGNSLARYYAEVARREPLLQPVSDELKLPFSWTYISDRMLTIRVVDNANLLEIYITDSNPERAAAIANLIGDKLIALSPTSPEKIEAERAAVEQQLVDSAARIEEVRRKISDLTAQRERATSASDLAEINKQLTETKAVLFQEEASYKSLLNYKTASETNSLSFFERAAPPAEPLPSKRILAIGIAALAGLLLSLAAIYMVEQVDQRWRSGRDLEDRFQVPDLGNVPSGPPISGAGGDFAKERERAVREVHTNIMLAASEGPMRSVMVSSPTPNRDRSTFSIDLAHMFAKSGHRVLVVDADLNEPHLTNSLLAEGQQQWHEGDAGPTDLWSHLRPTGIPNVALLPSSLEKGGAQALVPSLRWPDLVQQLHSAADVVIFDGPSALSSADAALLAPHVDGSVLVLSPESDTREDVAKSKARLTHRADARLLGAVTLIANANKNWTGRWPSKQLVDSAYPALPPASAPVATAATAESPSATVIITPSEASLMRDEPAIDVAAADAVAEPEAALVVEAASEPEVALVVEAASEPEAALAVEAASEPEAALAVEAASEPEAALAVEPVNELASEPEVALVVEAASEPEAALVVEAASEPEAALANEPEVALVVEAASEPEAARAVEAASEPEVALAVEAASEPEAALAVEPVNELAGEGAVTVVSAPANGPAVARVEKAPSPKRETPAARRDAADGATRQNNRRSRRARGGKPQPAN